MLSKSIQVLLLLNLRQAAEQYFTSSQIAFHFLRKTNGLWQTKQVLVGKSAFFSISVTGKLIEQFEHNHLACTTANTDASNLKKFNQRVKFRRD